jgi:dihydroflavonol-4-reductase
MIAASKHKIQRVVITSSIAAIREQEPDKDTHKYDEENWSHLPSADYSAYIKSKTLSELAAWDYHKEAEVGAHIPEIASINPSWILGEVIGCGL